MNNQTNDNNSNLNLEEKYSMLRKFEEKINTSEFTPKDLLKKIWIKIWKSSSEMKKLKQQIENDNFSKNEFEIFLEEKYLEKSMKYLSYYTMYLMIESGIENGIVIPEIRLSDPGSGSLSSGSSDFSSHSSTTSNKSKNSENEDVSFIDIDDNQSKIETNDVSNISSYSSSKNSSNNSINDISHQDVDLSNPNSSISSESKVNSSSEEIDDLESENSIEQSENSIEQRENHSINKNNHNISNQSSQTSSSESSQNKITSNSMIIISDDESEDLTEEKDSLILDLTKSPEKNFKPKTDKNYTSHLIELLEKMNDKKRKRDWEEIPRKKNKQSESPPLKVSPSRKIKKNEYEALTIIDSDLSSSDSENPRKKNNESKIVILNDKKKSKKKLRKEKFEEEAEKLEELMNKRKREGLLKIGKEVTKEMRIINPQKPENQQILIPEVLFILLKPHQIEGVIFLWDRICEKQARDRGAILAHSMGLGKTLQAIVFLYVALKENKFTHVLVVAPSGVIENWKNEFKKWLSILSPPIYSLNNLADKERIEEIQLFEKKGGIFIISQKMISKLISPIETDKPLSNERKNLIKISKNVFRIKVNCCLIDEGHLMTKKELQLTQALSTIDTRNRIALTGTPLQNNLKEMYQLINWVQPNYWSEHLFNEFYANPIRNGMKKDSSNYEVSLMKKRAFLLIRKLKPIVDRKNVDILRAELPQKTELVIGCRMTDFQRELYSKFLETNYKDGTPLFFYWHTIMKIVNHPDLVLSFMNKRNIPPADGLQYNYSWTKPLFKENYKKYDVTKSSKLEITLRIIEECLNQNEKILIFSQFTETLQFLESVLKRTTFKVHGKNITLNKGIDWFRMDGAVSTIKRQKMIDDFNGINASVKIFLISTKAGGMGINLTGANRILIYDVLWNPMWNSQALFRSYRYGQTRPVFVYRLCTIECIEEALWSRCTAKSWLFEKIVNESNPTRTITYEDLQLRPKQFTLENKIVDESIFSNDKIFSSLFQKMRQVIKEVYTYDSLYEEDIGDVLTETEKKQAEQEEKDLEKGILDPSKPNGLELQYMREPKQQPITNYQNQQVINLTIDNSPYRHIISPQVLNQAKSSIQNINQHQFQNFPERDFHNQNRNYQSSISHLNKNNFVENSLQNNPHLSKSILNNENNSNLRFNQFASVNTINNNQIPPTQSRKKKINITDLVDQYHASNPKEKNELIQKYPELKKNLNFTS